MLRAEEAIAITMENTPLEKELKQIEKRILNGATSGRTYCLWETEWRKLSKLCSALEEHGYKTSTNEKMHQKICETTLIQIDISWY